METIKLNTTKKEELIDITSKVSEIVSKSKIKEGACIVYCPHTTAAITINENADPDVKHDILLSLNNIVKELNFKHSEGNSSAHVKSSLVGKSSTVIIQNSKLILGTWDGIIFCEFDGPRSRNVFVSMIKNL